jgi:PAS domain S-box-containing protein
MSQAGPPEFRFTDFLAEVRQRLLTATDGRPWLILHRTASGGYRPGWAAGVNGTELAIDGREAAGLDALLSGGCARIATEATIPSLAAALGAGEVLLTPVEPVATRTALVTAVAEGASIPAELVALVRASLELSRAEREIHFHQRVREVLLLFSRSVSSALSLASALDAVGREIAAIFGASAAVFWLHDRRARELELVASSDGPARRGSRIPNDASGQPAAVGLRLDAPVLSGRDLIAPLRGWRRALGALVVHDVGENSFDPGELTDFARELTRQLSAAIENVQLVDEILRQRRLLEDTFNSLVDLVVVTDGDLRIAQTNEAFAARVGADRQELVGRPLQDLVGLEIAERAATATAGTPSAQAAAQVEDARLGGVFLVTATPLVSADSRTLGRVLVARDITRQTRLEREREGLRERLAQSEKLASLGQFVAGIAHEMNNPLQGVLGHLELLIGTSEQARPLRRQLRQIYQDADRAAKIVSNLLAFTGSHRMKRRRVQVDRLITRALASRRLPQKRLGIEVVRAQDERAVIQGDSFLLQQAFLNILINAEHALAAAPEGQRRIAIDTALDASASRVTIVFRDSGPGIPAHAVPRIFDPFFTTKDVGQGTGLGLAITYGIVQEHAGTISATNDPAGGASIRIDLPSAEVVVK